MSSYDFEDALRDLGVYPAREDLRLFIKRYDRSYDERLNYSEFCDAFTPKAPHHASALTARKPYHYPKNDPRQYYFVRETKDLLAQTFKVHFRCENSAEFVRKRLSRINLTDAFSAVD